MILFLLSIFILFSKYLLIAYCLSVTVLCGKAILKQGSANFSVKGQMVNTLAFVAHMVSDAVTHFYQTICKILSSAVDNM